MPAALSPLPLCHHVRSPIIDICRGDREQPPRAGRALCAKQGVTRTRSACSSHLHIAPLSPCQHSGEGGTGRNEETEQQQQQQQAAADGQSVAPASFVKMPVRCGSLVLAVVVAAIGLVAPSCRPAPVTIAAQPTDLRRDRLLTLFGTVASDRAKELVRIECATAASRCGGSSHMPRRRRAGGGHGPTSRPGSPRASARTGRGGRAGVRVRDRAYVELRRHGARTFAVSVRAKMSFVGRRTLLQHFDPARGWRTVASAALTESGAPPGRATSSRPCGSAPTCPRERSCGRPSRSRRRGLLFGRALEHAAASLD